MSTTGRSENDGGGGGGGDELAVHAGVEVLNKHWRYGEKIQKAKQVVVFPFRNVRSKLYRKKRSFSASSSGDAGCYPCFTPHLMSGSTVNPQKSDPKSPDLSYLDLKFLIEKNDFFSRECNVHLDIS